MHEYEYLNMAIVIKKINGDHDDNDDDDDDNSATNNKVSRKYISVNKFKFLLPEFHRSFFIHLFSVKNVFIIHVHGVYFFFNFTVTTL